MCNLTANCTVASSAAKSREIGGFVFVATRVIRRPIQTDNKIVGHPEWILHSKADDIGVIATA